MDETKKTKPGCCCCSAAKPEDSETKTTDAGDGQRRGFLGMLIAAGLGICALAVPAGAGILSVLTPMRWKSQAG